MQGNWKEVAKLRFKGDRFRDHALDLSAVTELRQFQKIIAETAKALWRAAHPDRERLPAHFEERTRLCLRRIEDGSATVPLEVFAEAPQQGELWEQEPEALVSAIDLAYCVFDSLEKNRPLPEEFPKELVSEYAEWGKTLGPDEYVEFQPSSKKRPTKLHAESRQRLAAFIDFPHTSTIDIVGEVMEADVRQRQFQVWIDSHTAIRVTFDESQEGTVTQALRDHLALRIRVRGRAEISPHGKPIRFVEVSLLELLPAGELNFEPNAPNIEDEIAQIAADVPTEAWLRLPTDFSDHLDHYLYGMPKQ